MGFQGGVKLVDKKPEPAFKMTLGGSDQLGAARFGEGSAAILETDLPNTHKTRKSGPKGPLSDYQNRKKRRNHRRKAFEIPGHL